MYFSKIATLLASAAVAAANTITFMSLDSTDRTLVFTPNAGHPTVEKARVAGGSSVSVTIPQGWIGNWYSVSDGAEDVPGMLGEVAFQGWNGFTYFDVSAIVNPNDHNGVREMYPAGSAAPTSGCKVFPCNNAYYLPDDVQTKVTSETTIVCTLGGGSSNYERAAEVEETSESVAHHLALRGF
jgi:hypothetical protein